MNTNYEMNQRRAARLCASLLLTILAGCNSGGGEGVVDRPRVEGWSQRRASGVSVDRATEATKASLQQWFGRVNVQPGSTLLVQGGPSEYAQKGGGDRIRDTVGFNNRLRRTATVQIRAIDDGCQIQCVVERQRLDTADHRVLQENRGGSDVPNATPIERDAGLTRDQQDSWTDLPRDRDMERTILNSILARLRGGDGNAATAENATDR